MTNPTAAVTAWLEDCRQVFSDHATELNHLDRAIGDGDHGSNLERGFVAACELHFEPSVGVPEALRRVGMAMVSSVGGASGPLFGTLFLRVGQYWEAPLTTQSFARCLRAGTQGVQARGKAEPGHATMVDALDAAAVALEQAAAGGLELQEALDRGAAAAREGAEATRPMVARRGRAAHFGSKSVGHIDPGAVSVALISESAAKFLA